MKMLFVSSSQVGTQGTQCIWGRGGGWTGRTTHRIAMFETQVEVLDVKLQVRKDELSENARKASE
jgi:hypothetical protein